MKPPEVISEENKAETVTVADYAKAVVSERNLKARTRIGYEASLTDDTLRPSSESTGCPPGPTDRQLADQPNARVPWPKRNFGYPTKRDVVVSRVMPPQAEGIEGSDSDVALPDRLPEH